MYRVLNVKKKTKELNQSNALDQTRAYLNAGEKISFKHTYQDVGNEELSHVEDEPFPGAYPFL